MGQSIIQATARIAAFTMERPMDLQLTNKKVLVSGSTAGIGFAIASLLAQEGASVVVNGRSQGRVDDAVKRIQKENKGAQVSGVAADLGTKEGVDLLTQAVPTLDVLVNNLGIFEAKPFPAITDEDWLRFFEVNVLSGVRLSRFYLPRMLEKNWGRIVFISSESGLNIPVEMIHYGVTKTAQIALARGLAETTAGTNVTVNSVLPGPTPQRASSDSYRTWRSGKAATRRPWKRISSVRCARPHSSSGLRPRTRWRRWWFMCAAHVHRPPMGRRCASMAAWFGPSCKRKS